MGLFLSQVAASGRKKGQHLWLRITELSRLWLNQHFGTVVVNVTLFVSFMELNATSSLSPSPCAGKKMCTLFRVFVSRKPTGRRESKGGVQGCAAIMKGDDRRNERLSFGA